MKNRIEVEVVGIIIGGVGAVLLFAGIILITVFPRSMGL